MPWLPSGECAPCRVAETVVVLGCERPVLGAIGLFDESAIDLYGGYLRVVQAESRILDRKDPGCLLVRTVESSSMRLPGNNKNQVYGRAAPL